MWDGRFSNDFISRAWLAHRWKGILALVVVIALVVFPLGARAQFGIDPCCAIISAGLNSISGLLKSVVAKPLSSIQQIQDQAARFEQQVVYPIDAINNARGLAGQLHGQLQQVTQLYRLPTNSATLAASQQFEEMLLSHDPKDMDQVSQSYAAVYGTVIAPTDAPQPVRDLVDMTDAEAQSALKKAVTLDALADVEMAAAERMNQQIQNAAPGSVPILEAQASAWLVRANAFTQSALAELIRVRSIDLANAGAQLKFGANDMRALQSNASQAMRRGAR